MPPKSSSKPQGPSKKTEQKKKVIEDKTFGLKNKKGAKQQKFIQQVQKQVQHGNNPDARKLEQQRKEEKAKKEAKLKQQEELNMLFKPVVSQKVPKNADPKSILCVLFKQGICLKGNKCKFSHDLTIERRAEKKNIYVDARDQEDEDAGITDRSGRSMQICKHFLDAVEKDKFGWFWECPNGGTKCTFRHALPEGFVLDKDKRNKDKEKKEEISLEDLIERERAALGDMSQLTRVTLDSFLKWKKRKLKEKVDKLKSDEDKKRSEFKAGRHLGLSGRDMFTFNPDMADKDELEDGDAEFDRKLFQQDSDDEDKENDEGENGNNVQYREICLDTIAGEASEVDLSQSAASMERMRLRLQEAKKTYADNQQLKDEQEKLDAAAGGGPATNDEQAEVPIDENLFNLDDDELEELENDLEHLEVQ